MSKYPVSGSESVAADIDASLVRKWLRMTLESSPLNWLSGGLVEESIFSYYPLAIPGVSLKRLWEDLRAMGFNCTPLVFGLIVVVF